MSNLYSHVLVKYSFDYADEFSIQGFGVYTSKKWNKIVRTMKEFLTKNPDHEFGFGTNEFVSFSDFESWESGINVEEICDLEAAFITRLFNLEPEDPTFGVGTNVISIQENEDDEDY